MPTELYAPAPVWLIVAAVAAELCFRWPSAIPHPVRLVGWLLNALEPRVRAGSRPRLAGSLGLAAAAASVAAVGIVLLQLDFFHKLIALLLAASGMALGELLRSCENALAAIEAGERSDRLEDARREVGQLVSRETSHLDATELRRALAETLAENFNDGFVAPLFWLTVTGPVGLWIYKTVSTADSMWGYLTPEWKEPGRAAAKTDDVLAFVPARLSSFLLWASAGTLRERWPGWNVVRAQARAMASPNAGWPMATAAWLHGGLMGGPTVYFGEVRDKPGLGPWPLFEAANDGSGNMENVPSAMLWTNERLLALIAHVRRAGLLGTAIAALVPLVFASAG